MSRTGHSAARAALTHQHAGADRDRLIADAVSGLVEEGPQGRRQAAEEEGPEAQRARGGRGGLIGASESDQGRAEE
ncbi:hypothetical protein [Streptomyces fagopyri]|uniref:hypothetical protein n=1 Tax=Streptomyces fagopyri TaxID=2662397 RepID=UPI0037202042